MKILSSEITPEKIYKNRRKFIKQLGLTSSAFCLAPGLLTSAQASNKLTDYNISANNGGWQWGSGGGTDAQPYFRIFNVWTQAKKFDAQCEYIKKWIPELKDIPVKDILGWDKCHEKHDIDYPKPIVDHKETRERALSLFKKYLK